MTTLRTCCVLLAFFSLAACGTYSSTQVKPTGQTGSAASTTVEPGATETPQFKSNRPATDPATIVLTTSDITDRKYQAIGDIKVTVNKATIFDKDPTPALVDTRLREKAAEIGADAVIYTLKMSSTQ